jgi:hypothetical protein
MRRAAAPSVRRIPAMTGLLWGLATLPGCEHTTPPEYEPPEVLSPAGTELPRRLTFNPGDDRNPSVVGGMVAFSRFELGPGHDVGYGGGARCIAFLPQQGGTLAGQYCPPPPPAPEDSLVTWVEPVVSADGAQIAYVWQKSYLLDVRTPRREVRVAPAERPAEAEVRWNALWTMPDGRRPTTVIKPAWDNPDRLRFLAGLDSVFKVKGGGSSRGTDTITVAYALVELDLTSGAATVVPGADSAIAYAPAPDGGTWIVQRSDSTRLLHLPARSAVPVEVGSFSAPVYDLANVDGVPVAGVAGATVEAMDLATGSSTTVGVLGGQARRVAAVAGTRRYVVEVEVATESFVGPGGVTLQAGSANLWLLELP